MRLTCDIYREVRARLAGMGYVGDWEWSQGLRPCDSPDEFACEYTWVVLNSGMKNTVARKIMDRVWPLLSSGISIAPAFGHRAKAAAIESMWSTRAVCFERFLAISSDTAAVLTWCGGLPWIGPITRYHLAKNLGCDVAKPDRWLVRLADAEGESVDSLCARLAAESGDRVATVDVVLWRACAIGLLVIVGGEININGGTP